MRCSKANTITIDWDAALLKSSTEPRSTAANWPPPAPLVAWEARLARRAQTSTATRLLYEFLRFGVKRAWACLFGSILVGLMLATSAFYPQHAALARYDFLLLVALAVQALFLAPSLRAGARRA